MSKQSNCSSCGDGIVWVRMKGGKAHPCNPEEIHWIDVEAGQKIVFCDESCENGCVEYITQQGIDSGSFNGMSGYESHFSTCPDADKWRRG